MIPEIVPALDASWTEKVGECKDNCFVWKWNLFHSGTARCISSIKFLIDVFAFLKYYSTTENCILPTQRNLMGRDSQQLHSPLIRLDNQMRCSWIKATVSFYCIKVSINVSFLAKNQPILFLGEFPCVVSFPDRNKHKSKGSWVFLKIKLANFQNYWLHFFFQSVNRSFSTCKHLPQSQIQCFDWCKRNLSGRKCQKLKIRLSYRHTETQYFPEEPSNFLQSNLK